MTHDRDDETVVDTGGDDGLGWDDRRDSNQRPTVGG